MGLHPNFPTSPYAPLVPEQRWFPAAEELRNKSYEKLLPPLVDTADYKIGMLKKQQLYQQEGKRLVSLYPADKPRLDAVLRAKLALFGHHLPA